MEAKDAAHPPQRRLRDRLPGVYDSFRAVAIRMLGQRGRGSLAPSDLLHEGILKLMREEDRRVSAERSMLGEKSESTLRACCAAAMRDVLVDTRRRGWAQKRGGGARPVELSPSIAVPGMGPVAESALSELLTQLEEFDGRLADLVVARVYGEATIAECAEALGVSRSTIDRDWIFVRAWLQERLAQ